MITFLLCLAALVIAYFTYGKYLEKVCGIDETNPVPSQTMYDGVDYIPMPRWKVFLIQLLNIAGLGPIFGALLGAAYGPVAFLWITLGGIFMGAMHDFIAGVISLKSNGQSLPEIIGTYLGNGTRGFMRIFSVLLMVLVGAVFIYTPGDILIRATESAMQVKDDVIALEEAYYEWLLDGLEPEERENFARYMDRLLQRAREGRRSCYSQLDACRKQEEETR